jgi:hypothetical protein
VSEAAQLGETSLDEVAGRLYGLLPEEFTAERAVEVRRARTAGSREVAAAIGRLRKPRRPPGS